MGVVHPSHFVHFYDEETNLYEVAGQFLKEGLSTADSILIIARDKHQKAVMRSLETHPRQRQQIRVLDAKETILGLMPDGILQPVVFNGFIGGVVDESSSSRRGAHVRIFAEMVDILWRAGDEKIAIELEKLWNGFLVGSSHPCSVLHCYAIGTTGNARQAHKCAEIVMQHA